MFADEPNPGQIGGQRADNLTISSYQSLSGLPQQNDFQDRFEPNGTLATAAIIGAGPGVHLDNLSLQNAGQQDWYKFQLIRPDEIDVNLGFVPANGELSLDVYDSADNVIAAGSPTVDGSTAALTNALAAGTYYVQISGVGGATNTYSLAIEPDAASTTRVYYVNDSSAAGDVYSLAPGNDANDGLTPSTPKATVQSLLDDRGLGPNDLVVIDTGTYGGGTVTIDAGHAGAAYAGSPYGSVFNYGGTAWNLVNATDTLLYGLTFSGNSTGIDASPDSGNNPSTGNTFLGNTFTNDWNALSIQNGDADVIQDNTISGGSTGIYVATEGAAGVTIRGNSVTGESSYAAYVVGNGPATINANTLAGSNTGLYLDAAASSAVTGNSVPELHDGAELSRPTAPAPSTFSETTRSTTTGPAFSRTRPAWLSTATPSTTTASASRATAPSAGRTGPPPTTSTTTPPASTPTAATRSRSTGLYGNTAQAILVDNSSGSVDIHHNVIYRNLGEGILLDRANAVTIENNTIYTPSGDCVRLQDGSSNVTLENNILWTDQGYDLYVATDSQQGFASDYNNLYTTQPSQATLVWWQKPFTDLFDWQVEANYDNHSIGYTSLDPLRDNPNFVTLAPTIIAFPIRPRRRSYRPASRPAIRRVDRPGDPRAQWRPHRPGGLRQYALAALSPSQFIRIDYPTYYTDFLANVGHVILWHAYDAGHGPS